MSDIACTLTERLIAATAAARAAEDLYLDNEEESLDSELQAASEAADAVADAARDALLASDEPRLWSFGADAEGAKDEELRPSEVAERLRELAQDGDWGTVEKTIWIDGRADCALTDEVIEVTTEINPEEPACEEAEHDWQSPQFLGGIKENPGVWGHGGGVIIVECCMHCGCKRTTDTWAQNPSNGVQGLESVSYDEGAYAELLAERNQESA